MKIKATINRELDHGVSVNVTAESEIHYPLDSDAVLHDLSGRVCAEADKIVKAEETRHEMEKDLPDRFVSKDNLRAILDCYGTNELMSRGDIIEALVSSEQEHESFPGKAPVKHGEIVEGLRQDGKFKESFPGFDVRMFNQYLTIDITDLDEGDEGE